MSRHQRCQPWYLLLTAVLVASLGTSCAKPAAEPSAASSNMELRYQEYRKNGRYTLPGPDDALRKQGQELLKEYEVGYDQTIRFPHDGLVYESYGAYPISSIEEVHQKYPDLKVPDLFGDYAFADFTIYREQTSVVFPDVKRALKNEIEVFSAETPEPLLQYYVCYQRDSNQYRIHFFPIGLYPEVASSFLSGMEQSQQRPNAYYSQHMFVSNDEQESDGEQLLIDRIALMSTPFEDYAFYIEKVTPSNCLDGKRQPMTEEEALSLYDAIWDGSSGAPQ